jgi:hypothetical protein
VDRGAAERWLGDADIVLNCGSTAGIEAAHRGWPVIELLPAGSRERTPADGWGLVGSAASFEKLCELLDRALRPADRAACSRSDVFARTGPDAARAIVDAILDSDADDHEHLALTRQEVR